MAVDDREAADTILLHGAECLLDRVVRADGDRLTFSKLRHLGRGRVLAVRNALHDDVSVGEHALEPVVIAADGHRAHVEISKLASGVGERVVDGYALRVGRHDVACSGHVFLLLDGGCLGSAVFTSAVCRTGWGCGITVGCDDLKTCWVRVNAAGTKSGSARRSRRWRSFQPCGKACRGGRTELLRSET